MSAQVNIINDVGTLLKIATKVWTELVDKACVCIGIGSLNINLVDMQCKFVPGKNLKTAIKASVASQSNPLEIALEQAFADKLLAICEEVI